VSTWKPPQGMRVFLPTEPREEPPEVALEAEPRAAPRPVHMQKCKFAKMGKCRFDKNCRFSHLGTKQFPQVRPFDEVVDPVRADAAAARNRLPKAVPESEASSDE
jgi:hypothetical protein